MLSGTSLASMRSSGALGTRFTIDHCGFRLGTWEISLANRRVRDGPLPQKIASSRGIFRDFEAFPEFQLPFLTPREGQSPPWQRRTNAWRKVTNPGRGRSDQGAVRSEVRR